jgi:hypothetical protein
MRYYLEIEENNDRLPVGNLRGYTTLDEAKKEAEKYVDDTLPANRVRVFAHVATAYLRGDGEAAVQDEK